MYWTDIVMLVLSVTLANHLGLVDAAEKVLKHKIPILNCAKCASFWSVLAYSILAGRNPIASVAVSFLCAYAALWLMLLYGYIDTLYNRIYENLYPTETGVEASAEEQLP